MKELAKERVAKLWGQEYVGSDYVVNEVHGDGMQIAYFMTLDSRPFCYYIRIDSGLDLALDDYDILSGEDKDHYGSYTEMLMQMIEEECDNIDRYEENEDSFYTCDQDIEEGIEPFEFKFPMLSAGTGYFWGIHEA